MKNSLFVMVLLVWAGVSFGSPCSYWGQLSNGVPASPFIYNGFVIPKVHDSFGFEKVPFAVSDTGSTVLDYSGGPGILYYQGFTLGESRDTVAVGSAASLVSTAKSVNLPAVTIIVDGVTRVDSVPISYWTGYAENCPAGNMMLVKKPSSLNVTYGATAHSYAKFIAEFPISFRESIQVICTAIGGEDYEKPSLYCTMRGWNTSAYVEDYNYFCRYGADTTGCFDYVDLFGMTTDTSGTGKTGGYARILETLSIPGTFDTAVVNDVTGAGNASNNKILESEVLNYFGGDCIRTTLADTVLESDTDFKVNYDMTGWDSFGQRAFLILSDNPAESRNFGDAHCTINVSDSTITFVYPDSVGVNFSAGDTVYLWLSDRGLNSGDFMINHGQEEFWEEAAWYIFGEGGGEFLCAKNPQNGGSEAINLDGNSAECYSFIKQQIPELSAFSEGAVKTLRLYLSQSSYVDEETKYYTIYRHCAHAYFTGAGGFVE